MFYQYQHFGVSEYFCKEYGKNFNFPSHLHQSFELITVFSGEMEIMVDEKVYKISKNEAVLVFPNQLHSLSCTDCEHMLCIFSPEIVKAFSQKYADKIPLSNKFFMGNLWTNALDGLSEESSKIKKKGVLYSICAEFDDSREYAEKNYDDRNLLYTIFEFVENNFGESCTLEDLAEKTGYSYSYLSRYFKGITGMSFNSYVNLYRISKACYLLNNSDCTVLQCAYECGYKSLRSFNRNFKMHTEKTPVEYRAKTTKKLP